MIFAADEILMLWATARCSYSAISTVNGQYTGKSMVIGRNVYIATPHISFPALRLWMVKS